MSDPVDESVGPYLEGLVGQSAGTKILLSGSSIVLGRDATECQIVLSSAVISKVQARFDQVTPGQITLVDLAGKQTTLVNGHPIDRCVLRPGDRIGFGVGGLMAFAFHSGSDGGLRDFPAETGPRVISRMVIPTGPLNEAAPAYSTGARPNALSGFGSVAPENPGTMILHAAQLPALRIGRAPDNDFVLDGPSVSRYHAMLDYSDPSMPQIIDVGSTNGTFVNGEPLTEPRSLLPTDLIFLGGYLLHVDGRTIKQHDLSSSSITARNIYKQIGGNSILQNISLAIKPREFVGLMGPSGCGKSTLMDALNGLRPATSGYVMVNDLDLYRNFNALRRSIGYVPQRDVLHDSLTVERTLYYVARLRLPEGTSVAAMNAEVDAVIETVGLTQQRNLPFRQLSGGQQKRLSLAFELITKPSFIFLDEPTSPLDPETTDNMMMLFRRLADEGRIVIMVTHKFEKFHSMHQVAMMARGGRLAYYGPPAEALNYFGCNEVSEIYRVIGSQDPDALSDAYQRSPQFQRYVVGRIAEADSLGSTSGNWQASTAAPTTGPERRFGVGQWSVLTRRYLETKLNDRRNTILLLVQAPIVALALALIVRNSPVNDSKTLFIAAIVSVWFGANNAVREIVSETAIFVRERLVNLKIPSYVLSKFTVLAGIALAQCLLFVMIMVVTGRLAGEDFISLTFILYLTSLAGVAMGLFISSVVSSSEKAMSLLPLILIPQLLLSGFMVSIDDIYYTQNGRPATKAQYQNFEQIKNRPAGAPGSTVGAPPEALFKYDGLGAAGYLTAVITARWTLEALAHDVSIADTTARDRLATRMTVAEYQTVFDGKTDEAVASAYRWRVGFDCGVLAGFSLVFLSLAFWALKRKDVL